MINVLPGEQGELQPDLQRGRRLIGFEVKSRRHTGSPLEFSSKQRQNQMMGLGSGAVVQQNLLSK